MTLSDEIKAMISTLEMQLNGFAKTAYEKDLRIAELESRIEFNGDHSQDGIVKCDERIADLERQLRNAKFAENLDAEDKAFFASLRAPSAPAVEQQPVAYLRFRAAQQWSGVGGHDIDHNEWLETCHSHEIGDDKMPAFPVYTAPQAADTDKVREAILALRIVPPRHYDNAQISAFCLGAKTMCEEAARLTASMAAQAPVREVPEGWQLVPKTITHAMAKEINLTGTFTDAALQVRYSAMLDAAPLPAAPVQQEGK